MDFLNFSSHSPYFFVYFLVFSEKSKRYFRVKIHDPSPFFVQNTYKLLYEIEFKVLFAI